MSSERPDGFDEISHLRPVPPKDSDLPPLRSRPEGKTKPEPAFGFWMAVLWCVLYLIVTQFLALIFCGIPIIFVFMAIEVANNGQGMLNDPAKQKEWVQGDDGRLMMLTVLIASHLVGVLFGWIMIRWRIGRQWKRRMALTRWPSITHWVLILIGFPALLGVSSAVEQPIMKYVPSVQDLLNRANIDFEWPGIEAVEPLLKKTPFLLAFFAVAILPAVNEEFWCRGFLGRGLAGRYPMWAVMLMTSFLFGAIHLEPRQGLWAMFFGAAIYATYVATRSLWAAMFIHFVNNGLAVLHSSDQIGWPLLQPISDLLERSPLEFVSASSLLLAAVGYALYQTRCKLISPDDGLVWEPPGVSSVELPPPGSGTIVTHDPLSPLSVSLVVVGAVAFGLVLTFA